jgi:Secretion system C-terminal sorting domain
METNKPFRNKSFKWLISILLMVSQIHLFGQISQKTKNYRLSNVLKTCETWNIANNTGALIRVNYADCNLNVSTIDIPSGGQPRQICVVTNDFYTQGIGGVTSYPDNTPIQSVPNVATGSGGSCLPIDPCAGVTANWVLTGNTRCIGNDRESEYHDNNISCTNNQNYWAITSVNGCYVDPCAVVTANWVLTENTRCNGNDRESEYHDNNISCTNNQNYWAVTSVNGCYVDPCAGVMANWVLTGNTRCVGNDRESEYHDNNIACTNNQNYWTVTTVNGCYVDPCAGVTANWVLTGNTRCVGNDRESEYHDNNISCTNNQNYWVVTTVNGCYIDPCAGVNANWVLTGNTRCVGNDRESEYHDNNISCTNNQNYWAVTTVNGCYVDPCAGVTANWVLTGSTRCNGNDRESEYHDNNISCTNNQNYWVVTTVNGCYIDPCAGVNANWVLTGNTRCNGNDRESEYHDNNISCTNNQNYWAVTIVNGCYVNPCAGIVANWVLTGNTRCVGNDRESEYHDNNISCTNNQNYWAVTTINGCYIDSCAGVTANWVLTGNTRCNGNDRESEFHDNNISCTNNQNYWAVTTVNGCYVDPCAGVTANWVLTGNIRCNGNDRESEYHDNNISCTNNQNYWAVTTVNGCFIDQCAGITANWVLTGNTRCNGNDRESEYHDNNISCTNNQNYWAVTTVNGCYVDPCAGVTANWVLTGNTRCVGNDRESEYHDNNISCTNNQNYWAVTTVNGCYVDPCAGVTANWVLTGNTRCVGNDRESEYHDNNISCTNNQNYWAITIVNGCFVDPCAGVTANWVLTGNTRCVGNDRESEYHDNNISCTNNQNYWAVTTVNGCFVDPCAGVMANWIDTGQNRCNGNASEKEIKDLNANCTNNQNQWIVVNTNGCNPCFGVVANWEGTGDTRCNGDAKERRRQDLNKKCTGNEDVWDVIDSHGCDPCWGVQAAWQGTGETRCNNNNLERKSIDVNNNCTRNADRWDIIELNGCLVETPIGTIKWNNPTNKVVQNPLWNDTEMDVCFGDTVKVEAKNQALNEIEWQIDSTLSLVGASYVNILSDLNAENSRIYHYRAVKTTSTGIQAYSDWGAPLIVRVKCNPNKPIVADMNICPGKIAEIIGLSDSTNLVFDFGLLIPLEQTSELGKISAKIKPDSSGNYSLKSTNIFGCSAIAEFKVIVFEAAQKPIILATNSLIKYGESSSLTVENCNGIVHWENGETGNSLEVNPIISSTFKAKCITENGCESDLREIQISVLPQIPEIIGTTKMLDGTENKGTEHTICSGDFLALSNLIDFKGKLNWYADGVKMDSMVVGFYPNKNTVISAKSVNEAGESDESNAITITTRSSDLVDDLVVVYPNPTSDKVKIRSENCMKGIRLKLFTLLGQEIYNNAGTSFQGNELIFDISTLPTSQYILKIYNEQNQVIGRRIVKGGNASN